MVVQPQAQQQQAPPPPIQVCHPFQALCIKLTGLSCRSKWLPRHHSHRNSSHRHQVAALPRAPEVSTTAVGGRWSTTSVRRSPARACQRSRWGRDLLHRLSQLEPRLQDRKEEILSELGDIVGSTAANAIGDLASQQVLFYVSQQMFSRSFILSWQLIAGRGWFNWPSPF